MPTRKLEFVLVVSQGHDANGAVFGRTDHFSVCGCVVEGVHRQHRCARDAAASAKGGGGEFEVCEAKPTGSGPGLGEDELYHVISESANVHNKCVWGLLRSGGPEVQFQARKSASPYSRFVREQHFRALPDSRQLECVVARFAYSRKHIEDSSHFEESECVRKPIASVRDNRTGEEQHQAFPSDGVPERLEFVIDQFHGEIVKKTKSNRVPDRRQPGDLQD